MFRKFTGPDIVHPLASLECAKRKEYCLSATSQGFVGRRLYGVVKKASQEESPQEIRKKPGSVYPLGSGNWKGLVLEKQLP